MKESRSQNVSSEITFNMQRSVYFQKFRRDIVYVLVIGGLVTWIWMDGKRQEAWNSMALKDLKNACNIIDFKVETSKLTMQKENNYYSSDQSDLYFNRALKSRWLLDTFFMKKLDQFQTSLSNNSGHFTRSLSLPALQSLGKEAWLVTDSISKLIDGDPDLNPNVWNCLLSRDIWENAQNATPLQTEMFIQSLRFRALMLNQEVNGYFYNKIMGVSCFDMWREILPFIWAEKPMPFTGENYYAIINLSKRYRNTSNITLRMDGKLLPNGVFSELCTTPGEKKHILEFEMRNPMTGLLEYGGSQSFSYTVVDSCR
jgi:hypothetical protein